MLINADVKGLEVCCAAYLSGDPVLNKEILDGVDIHAENQMALALPTRLIAKTFIFRLIYGGSAFSYAKDPNFNSVSDKPAYWQAVIDNFYDKYQGLYKWHEKLVQDVVLTGKYVSPVGREYTFKPYKNNRGEWQWPRTTILNYPVQGFGADLMTLMRVSLWNRLRKNPVWHKVRPLVTVHDSVMLDTPPKLVDEIVKLIEDVASDVPRNFFKLWKSKYHLPFVVEIEVGRNYLNMEKVNHANYN